MEGSYSSFEAKINLWKKEVDLFINILENHHISDNIFEDIVRIIKFVEENKSMIQETLFKDDILELAEDITSSATLLECASDECYILDDGSKVYFPITKDDFFNSLYIESLTINFNKNNNSFIELILLNNPDYFNGSYFIINIDENSNIKFIGLED
ncbi:DUF2262 domain-containing protein [Methanobrevibacter arboriphilus]|uniref:DUF2262 domain-containing protein n=1 Tax=Methanobrevibacter arboriphilus TaxID=39441 RepID=UPI001CDACD47|nr:DUF2262 domain-containing protein [Methanobrevibacter arboriphilus]